MAVCCLGGVVYAQEIDEKVYRLEQNSDVSKSQENTELSNQILRSEDVKLTGAMLLNAELSAVCVESYRWEIKVSCLGESYEPADAYLWFTLSTSERYDFHYVDNDGVRNDDWGYQVVSSNEVIVPFLGNGTDVFCC